MSMGASVRGFVSIVDFGDSVVVVGSPLGAKRRVKSKVYPEKI